MNNKLYVIALVLSLSLSGCATTSKGSSDDEKAAEYLAQLGIGYLERNRLDLANDNLERALKRNPRSANAQHYYALLQDKLGDRTKANHYYRLAMRQDGNNSELLNNYGSHLCQIGRYAEAVQAFYLALRDPLYPTPEFAYTNAGTCLQRQGAYDEAEKNYRQALQRKPNFALALYRMAELEHKRGENAKAQAFLYRYNEQGADTPETLLLCYRIHRALNEPTKAESCATQLLARFAKSPQARSLNNTLK